jgi:hypothetical protein
MTQLNPVSRYRYLLVILAGIFLFMLQGCVTNSYNNKNWRRSPPSTGHNRCGCLMQNPNQLTPKLNGEIFQA